MVRTATIRSSVGAHHGGYSINPTVSYQMPYTLWSRGRLLGYTDLDIPCVQPFIRQGFINPTQIGNQLLADAAGVPKACAASRRAARLAGQQALDGDLTEFIAACERREALALELRDEAGERFDCEWVRVNDIQDQSWADDLDDLDEEPLTPELEEAIERDAELLMESFDEDIYGSSWPPPDIRWETMQYHMMVKLTTADVGMDGL
jgi:hypothetical protein